MMNAAIDLRQVEDAIRQEPPPFTNAENLLDWYIQSGHHALELRATEVFARLEAVDDPALQSAAYAFLMSPPNGLRYRVRAFLNRLDRHACGFSAGRSDSNSCVGRGAQSAFFPILFAAGGCRPKHDVWILVMDGMRYDTMGSGCPAPLGGALRGC